MTDQPFINKSQSPSHKLEQKFHPNLSSSYQSWLYPLKNDNILQWIVSQVNKLIKQKGWVKRDNEPMILYFYLNFFKLLRESFWNVCPGFRPERSLEIELVSGYILDRCYWCVKTKMIGEVKISFMRSHEVGSVRWPALSHSRGWGHHCNQSMI